MSGVRSFGWASGSMVLDNQSSRALPVTSAEPPRGDNAMGRERAPEHTSASGNALWVYRSTNPTPLRVLLLLVGFPLLVFFIVIAINKIHDIHVTPRGGGDVHASDPL